MYHVGHVRLLQRAKALGDYLVVGLSTDAFNAVKHKESVYNYEQRKEILESVRFVDFVFPETCWEQKIADVQRYQINVFVMGEDWRGCFDFLTPHCEVVYLPRTDSTSTALIKDILGKR
jgi:glycerol-3-phosphate cytidylyltransferase